MSIEKPLFSKKEIPDSAKPVQTAQHFFHLSLVFSLAIVLIAEKPIDVLYLSVLPFSVYHSWQVAKTGYALTNNEVYLRSQNPVAYWVNLSFSIALPIFLAWLLVSDN